MVLEFGNGSNISVFGQLWIYEVWMMKLRMRMGDGGDVDGMRIYE